MKNKSLNKLFQAILNIMIAIAVTPLLLSLFIESPYIPTIDEIHSPEVSAQREGDSVTYFNVDEGNAALIYSNGVSALIDTGDGKSTDIVRSLKQSGVDKIDTLILTHWHSDHIGGAIKVLKEFSIRRVVMPRMPEPGESVHKNANEFNDAAEEAGVLFTTLRPGLGMSIGNFRINVLYYNPEHKSENNRSAIIMAKCNDKKFLFTSDAEIVLEKELLRQNLDLDCDVFLVGMHGSSSSNCDEFLKAVSPEYAVISVGLKNPYGHPSSKVINKLKSLNAKIYRTDTNGQIDVYIKNGSLEFTTGLSD